MQKKKTEDSPFFNCFIFPVTAYRNRGNWTVKLFFLKLPTSLSLDTVSSFYLFVKLLFKINNNLAYYQRLVLSTQLFWVILGLLIGSVIVAIISFLQWCSGFDLDLSH